MKVKETMRKIIGGIIIGSILALFLQHAWESYHFREDVYLFEIAKSDLEHKLKGARVSDVVMRQNSKATVNYDFDRLYDVVINYQRDGKIKEISTQYGISGGTWTGPDSATFERLDQNPETIYRKSKNAKLS
jgi:hypothetical protein